MRVFVRRDCGCWLSAGSVAFEGMRGWLERERAELVEDEKSAGAARVEGRRAPSRSRRDEYIFAG